MIIPTIVEKNYEGHQIYDIYSRLLKDRIIFISGEINDDTASLVISELLYLDSINHNDISIYINSPGGSVTAGLAIYDTMKIIKSDVETIGVGMSASMGAFLLSSGTKGKRSILENAEVMIHEILGGAQGQATEIKIHADHLVRTREKLNKFLSERTGKPLDVIEKDTERDNYMTAEEALEYGLIDGIMTKRA